MKIVFILLHLRKLWQYCEIVGNTTVISDLTQQKHVNMEKFTTGSDKEACEIVPSWVFTTIKIVKKKERLFFRMALFMWKGRQFSVHAHLNLSLSSLESPLLFNSSSWCNSECAYDGKIMQDLAL